MNFVLDLSTKIAELKFVFFSIVILWGGGGLEGVDITMHAVTHTFSFTQLIAICTRHCKKLQTLNFRDTIIHMYTSCIKYNLYTFIISLSTINFLRKISLKNMKSEPVLFIST